MQIRLLKTWRRSLLGWNFFFATSTTVYFCYYYSAQIPGIFLQKIHYMEVRESDIHFMYILSCMWRLRNQGARLTWLCFRQWVLVGGWHHSSPLLAVCCEYARLSPWHDNILEVPFHNLVPSRPWSSSESSSNHPCPWNFPSLRKIV